MPLPNRVTPFGDIVAMPQRGLLFGNRGGRIHDPATRTLGKRRWASRRWICCVTSFRGRQRRVFGPGYTELFFLDEVTALAAGHRPCMECRRADALAFRAAVSRALEVPSPIACDPLDLLLHGERLDRRTQRRHRMDADELPDGAVVVGPQGEALALRGNSALVWSADGYAATRRRPPGVVETLTPPVTVAALRENYRPLWHQSAERLHFDSTS